MEDESSDALSLLIEDHKELHDWFIQYNHLQTRRAKYKLAMRICAALAMHATVEGDIFYPALLSATKNSKKHHESEMEHLLIGRLISAIRGSSESDTNFDAKVNLLIELSRYHMKKEVLPGGMFEEAQNSGMDLIAVGEQILARKAELMQPIVRR